MFGLTQRGTLRWKEWVPLVTQQQRLRSLIQIIAYNIKFDLPDDMDPTVTLSYFYTLHLNSLSSPFYTSEKLESENPKWTDIEINPEIGAAPGVVVRLWAHPSVGDDVTVTVWSVYFSGLVYLGPRLMSTDPSELGPNSIIFHMHGGFFTSCHCFQNPQPATPRTLSVHLPSAQVKPSYSVNLFLRLQSMQQAIARQGAAAASIREEMTSATGVKRHNRIPRSQRLRRLLAGPEPPPRDEVVAINKRIEALKFKVHLLYQQRDVATSNLETLRAKALDQTVQNQNAECELMSRYHRLSKEVERLTRQREETEEVRCRLHQLTSLLDARKKQLISQLYHVYPIKQESDSSYTILGVRLPDAESLDGEDDVRVSVALGFVAHLVHMISIFLNVPTRYPICHFGSRSKIIDHITDMIPDKDREFPLYRGKDKLLFQYGVYLLNKNIAQLRWVCGITTTDLKATLPNLLALLSLSPQEEWTVGVSRAGRDRAARWSGNGGGGGGRRLCRDGGGGSDPVVSVSSSYNEEDVLLRCPTAATAVPSSPSSDTPLYRRNNSSGSDLMSHSPPPTTTSSTSDPQVSSCSEVLLVGKLMSGGGGGGVASSAHGSAEALATQVRLRSSWQASTNSTSNQSPAS